MLSLYFLCMVDMVDNMRNPPIYATSAVNWTPVDTVDTVDTLRLTFLRRLTLSVDTFLSVLRIILYRRLTPSGNPLCAVSGAESRVRL